MAFLDQLLGGIKTIQQGITNLIQRSTLSFQGAGVTVADDPANQRTVVTIAGLSGGIGQTNITLANGSNENVNPGGLTVLRIGGPTGPFSIGGFVAPAVAGTVLTVINTTTNTLTFNHEDVGSSAVNRLDLQSSGGPLILKPLKRAVSFVYDNTASRWVLQNPGLVRPIKFNVIDFGADSSGSIDSTAAIQNAITTGASTPSAAIVFPVGKYLISSTLTINGTTAGPGFATQGMILEAETMPRAGGQATLLWTGSAPTSPMLQIRNAIYGRVSGLSFEANGLAGYCLQLVNVPSQDLNTVDGWTFDGCSFADPKTYHVLIGDSNVNGLGAGGQCFLNSFRTCRFEASTVSASTVASVFHRSANSLENQFENCLFGGSGGFPTYGMVVESGTVVVQGGVSQVQRTLSGGYDFYLPTPGGSSPQVPGGISVFDFDSQSDQFINVAPASGGANSQYTVTIVNVNHSDTFGTGVYSVYWNRTGFATLNVVGGNFGRKFWVQSQQRNVFVHGTQLLTGEPSNHPELVIGNWANGAQLRMTDVCADFILPANAASSAIATQHIPDATGKNTTEEFIIDVVAANNATNNGASWRNKRATYMVSGAGVMSAVGAEIGTVSPDQSNGPEAANYRLTVIRTNSNTQLSVLVDSHAVNQTTDWKIRIQSIVAY